MDYRSYVGPSDKYDLIGASQFNLLTLLGLREHHFLLDIGCGSLRGGRLFIPYLLSGRYYGIEPNKWLVEEGFKQELGGSIKDIKKPTFDCNSDFNFKVFNNKFDYILAQSIFSHASASLINLCLSGIKQVMNNDGCFAATYLVGQDYSGCENWIYPGCVFYKEETMIRFANDNGLECHPINWRHPNGQKWLLFLHKEICKKFVDKIKIINLLSS